MTCMHVASGVQATRAKCASRGEVAPKEKLGYAVTAKLLIKAALLRALDPSKNLSAYYATDYRNKRLALT
jgi:hypothetical protein